MITDVRKFSTITIIVSLLLICSVTAFTPLNPVTQQQHHSKTISLLSNPSSLRLTTNTLLAERNKKGFGDVEPKSTKKKAETVVTTTPSAPFTTSSERVNVAVKTTTTTTTVPATTTESSSTPQLNAGQVALEKMRRERAEQKDAELRKVRELLQADEQMKTTPAAIPEKVAQRMGQRMLPFVGVPLFLALGTFVGFWYMATYRDLEFQPGLVATSTIILLGVGLLGITYSVMSASWDPDREGDFFGFEEFQRNIKNIQQGFSRTKENAVLREKMAGLSPEEIQAALKELEKRETKDTKSTQSLQSKIQNELE